MRSYELRKQTYPDGPNMGPDNNSLYFSSHNLNGCGRVGVERPASGLIQHLYLPANYPAMRGYPPTPTTLHSLLLYSGLAAARKRKF